MNRDRMSFLVAAALIVSGVASVARAEPPIVTVGTRTLALRDDPFYLGKRKISWAVRSVNDDPAHQTTTPVAGSESDPTPAGTTGGGAVLTVYNSAGTGESVTVVLPAARWHQQGATTGHPRYVYAADSTTEPVWRVYVKGPKLSVRGGKKFWSYTLDEASQGSIAIRLTLGSGVTYCTDVLPRDAFHDRPNAFTGRFDMPAPATCPPVP